jgi:hypothetical protein
MMDLFEQAAIPARDHRLSLAVAPLPGRVPRRLRRRDGRDVSRPATRRARNRQVAGFTQIVVADGARDSQQRAPRASGRPSRRPCLRPSHSAPPLGIHRRSNPDAGRRHRRQHGGIHDRQRRAARTVPLHRFASARAAVRTAAQRSVQVWLLTSGLRDRPRPGAVVLRLRRVPHHDLRALECGDARARDGRTRVAGAVFRAGRRSCDRPIDRG